MMNQLPRRPRFVDEFNNNNGSVDDILNAKRAYSKLAALRALNDIYNVQRNSIEQRSSQFYAKNATAAPASPARDAENNDVVSINNDDDNTIVPEKTASLPDVKDYMNGKLLGKAKSDWFDYTEIGKWVQKTQETIREGNFENNNEPLVDSTTSNGDKSLDELLTQVVELDKIYDDTHLKLIEERHQQRDVENSNDVEMDVRDNQTYTSLQMAMKNPVWVQVRRRLVQESSIAEDTTVPSPIIAVNPDAAPPRPPPPVSRIKRDVTLSTAEEPLPPLPPKRIRKTPSMPVLPRAPSSQGLSDQQQHSVMAPHKNLPTPPTNTLPKQNKPGLFSKLFSKKAKKEDGAKEGPGAMSSTTSLPGLGRASSESSQQIATKLPPVRALLTNSRSLELEGDETPPYGVELTEAEHYALYTAMAPHATASEFDEMSFYYSPVEGGKILEAKEVA